MVEINKNEINGKLNKIKVESKINEPYLVAILWNKPEDAYGEYGDILNRDHFINEEWGFFYQLGKDLYKDGVKNFDDITIMKKVKLDGTENLFDKYGGFDVIEDAINIIKERDSDSNIKYYSESVLRNYTIRKLYSLFGAKILVDTDKYKFSEMSRDDLIIYWGDKMNSIALESTTSVYETENLYIDAEEFLLRLKQDGDEMLKFSNSPLLNSITQGMPRGHVTMIGGFGNSGKALSCITKIPTPNGWTTMGEVKVGDEIFGQDGKPTKVLWKSPIYTDHDVYKMTFSDKEVIYADANHQWNVKTDHSVSMWRKNKKIVDGDKNILDGGYYTTTTEDIAKDAVRRRNDNKGNVYKYSVPLNEAIECNEKELPISPYLLGFWLGDGKKNTSLLTVFDDDVKEVTEFLKNNGFDYDISNDGVKKCKWVKVEEKGAKVGTLRKKMKELGIFNNKHIPEIYMRSSIEQRMELLQGLMDSDGTVDSKMGCAEWSQKDEVLTDQFCELLASLGFRYSKNKRKTKCQTGEFESFRVHFFTSKAKSAFKLKRYIDCLPEVNSQRQERKSIVSVELVESIPVQCLAVDNEDSLFLVGEHMTVTHNSSITADKVTMACIENGENMLVLLNEEDAQAYRQKILLSILHRDKLYIDRKKLVRGDLSEEDRAKVKRGFEKLNEYLNGDEAQIKIIFMEKYVMKDLEKIIRFWANRGYTNLLIDTHKVSDDSTHNARWETFVEDMKTIYRLTRKNAGGCNLRTVVTFQLADSAIRNRFLDFEAIGEGKASKNEASTVLMFRACWADEYEGGKYEIEYYTLDKREDGKYRKNMGKKLPKYDKNGNKNIYYLLFTPKNRSGSTNATGQEVLILQARFHANSFQEIGWTTIMDDKGSRR